MGNGFDDVLSEELLPGDGFGQIVFSDAAHILADSAATGLKAGFSAKVGRGSTGSINMNGMAALPFGGALDASPWMGREQLQLSIWMCVFVDASGAGAPYSLWCWRRVGIQGPCGGGWKGSWWGRRRRRQMVEEGRDVSGKSWAGRVVAR